MMTITEGEMYLATSQYLDCIVAKNPDAFRGMLAEDVEFHHKSNVSNNQVINGIEAVFKAFKENFFDVVSEVSPTSVEINADEMPYQEVYRFQAHEKKKDGTSYKVDDRTWMVFTKSESGKVLVSEIHSDVAILKD